jgi:chromosome segregation ATPase
MADKPKTYPQQVQELKQQLEEAITDREDALRQASFIPELQDKISELNAQLAARAAQDQSGSVNTKAQTTDLIQRAESAEQGLRNLQAAHMDLKAENASLEQQLDILGAERDKNRGKDDKLNLLSEELKSSNLRVVSLSQQLRDTQQGHNEAYARQEKEIIYLRQLAKAQKDLLIALTQEIEAIPYDGLQALRNLAKNG